MGRLSKVTKMVVYAVLLVAQNAQHEVLPCLSYAYLARQSTSVNFKLPSSVLREVSY